MFDDPVNFVRFEDPQGEVYAYFFDDHRLYDVIDVVNRQIDDPELSLDEEQGEWVIEVCRGMAGEE